ncbi:cAMP-specific 3',5'-cyclic phosphodiesterase 4B isoform X2, partial [Tachysurus ichikawai]
MDSSQDSYQSSRRQKVQISCDSGGQDTLARNDFRKTAGKKVARQRRRFTVAFSHS